MDVYRFHYPYLRTRAKHVQNTCKTRVLHVRPKPTRTGDVFFHPRGVFFRTKSRTKCVFLVILMVLQFIRFYWGKPSIFFQNPPLGSFSGKFESHNASSAMVMLKVLVRTLEKKGLGSVQHAEVGIQQP